MSESMHPAVCANCESPTYGTQRMADGSIVCGACLADYDQLSRAMDEQYAPELSGNDESEERRCRGCGSDPKWCPCTTGWSSTGGMRW